MWRLVGLGVAALVFAGLIAFFRQEVPRPPAAQTPQRDVARTPSLTPRPTPTSVEVVATGLEVPWAIAFAPDGTIYATERPGRLVQVREGRRELVAEIPDVAAVGEGGLLGLALDPQFAGNHLLYLYYTTRRGRALVNRVVRYRLEGEKLVEDRALLDGIPGAQFHDGGRIAFGPDGNLYVTTGDAKQPSLAQDLNSLAGKILRLRPDGSPPSDNPFKVHGILVLSLGHRNPQGLAWAGDGTLYATEHGPSNVPPDCCHDEVNQIEKSQNYGWPFFAGGRRYVGDGRGLPTPDSRLATPLAESGPDETWAPGGAAVVGRTLVFAGLRGRSLYTLDLDRPERGVRAHFTGQFGRLRDVVQGPDGALYVTTSNRDGRGEPRPDDDRILRVDPTALR